MKQITMFLFVLALLALTPILGTAQEVKASHGQEISMDGLESLIDQLEANGEFKNHGSAQSLRDKLPDLEGFKRKLDQNIDKGRISADGFTALDAYYDEIIHNNNWLTVVHEGQTNAVIIIADDAVNDVSNTANTLAEYVQKSTGAVLPVMTSSVFTADEENFAGHNRIYVGQSAPGDEADIEAGLDGIDEQGFMIHPNGKDLTIIGPTEVGTRNGVYEFLELYVGVHWLMIGPDGEDVPQLTDIEIPREDVIEEPAFQYRYLSGRIDNESWSQFNKLQNGNTVPIQFMHNLFKLFASEKYPNSPEFYPNGVPAVGDTRSWNPCFSTATKDAAVAELIAYFNDNPNATSYSLGINDSKTYCQTNEGYGDYPTEKNSVGDLHMSEIYYAWVNDIVEEVLVVHPDKWFGLLAYDNVTDPPAFELNDRVVPFFTKDRMSWIDEGVKAQGHNLMDEWKTKATQVAWYDYMYGTQYVLPRVYPHLMAENFQYAADNNVYGHYIEMYHNAGDGPKSWIAAKLFWDPYQDVDALLQEWYERAVGVDAADDLAALYEIWEEFWTEDIKQSQWFETAKTKTYLNFNALDFMYLTTNEDIEQSMNLIESVVAKAGQTGTAAQQERAAKLHSMFKYYEAGVLSYPRTIDPIVDEAGALSLLSQIENNLNDRVFYVEERLRLKEEVFENDPALRFRSSVWHDFSPWNSSEFWYLVKYIRENEPTGGSVRDQVDLIVDTADESAITSFAEMLQGVYEGTLSPLTANSSYEEGTVDATSWTFWNPGGTGSIQRVEEISHTGDASVFFDGTTRAGTYQTFGVATGLTASEVNYYSPAGTTTGGVRLVVSLRSETGRTLTDLITPTVPLADTAGEWASIGVFEKIPKYMDGQEVKSVLINAQVYAPDSQVYLDDVNFYQIESIEEPEPVVEDPILTKNSSFELGGTNATDWTFWTTNNIGSIERVEGIARTGNASVLVDHLEARGAPLQIFDAVEGELVTKLYMYTPAGTVTENATIELKMEARAGNSRLLTFTTGRVDITDTAGEWIPVEVRGRVPAEVNGVAVDNIRVIAVFTDAGDLQVYLDDFTVTKELTENSSFEEGSTNATFWGIWTSSSVGSIDRVEGIARTGNASLLVDHLQDRGGPHQTFEAPVGELLAQLYYSTPAGTVTSDATVELTMHVQDANNNRLFSIRSDRTVIVDTSGEWVPFELSGIIPEEYNGVEVATVRVIATFTRVGDVEINIDDFTVTRK